MNLYKKYTGKTYSWLVIDNMIISALSLGKIDNYEYISGEEILLPDQRRVIDQAKFSYSSWGKAFEKNK